MPGRPALRRPVLVGRPAANVDESARSVPEGHPTPLPAPAVGEKWTRTTIPQRVGRPAPHPQRAALPHCAWLSSGRGWRTPGGGCSGSGSDRGVACSRAWGLGGHGAVPPASPPRPLQSPVALGRPGFPPCPRGVARGFSPCLPTKTGQRPGDWRDWGGLGGRRTARGAGKRVRGGGRIRRRGWISVDRARPLCHTMPVLLKNVCKFSPPPVGERAGGGRASAGGAGGTGPGACALRGSGGAAARAPSAF